MVRRRRTDHEDGIAERIHPVEGAGVPFLFARWTKNRHLGTPFLVMGIGVVNLE